MMNDAAALHALIVSATDNLAVANQNRANRDAALRQASPGFGNRALEEGIDRAI